MAAYKTGAFTAGTIAPRDAVSISENPPFLSLSGANANFLHIDPTIATGTESGAATGTGILVDYDGDLRQDDLGYLGGGTAPDMGADEFEGTPLSVCSGTPAASTITGVNSVCWV